MLAVNCRLAPARLSARPLLATRRLRHGIHGGDVETSLMLAFRPETVQHGRGDELRAARRSRWNGASSICAAIQPIGFGWMSQDLNPAGAMGEAARATAQKGELSADHGAQAFVALLREIDAFELVGS